MHCIPVYLSSRRPTTGLARAYTAPSTMNRRLAWVKEACDIGFKVEALFRGFIWQPS